MHRLEPVLQAMAKAVHHYGGTVNRMHGDGIMALFGAPLAYEDHAVRACFAARAMIDAVASLRENQVDIRVGLNSGEVVVHSIGHDLSMEYDAVGLTTHLANRMEQLATAGTACMTAERRGSRAASSRSARAASSTSRASRARSRSSSWSGRPIRPAGRCEPRPIASLSSSVAQPSCEDLADALRHTKQGRGQIVAVAGEAGMGKSRLVHEFLQRPGY